MAFSDLREFITALDKSGDLVRIKKEVDWDMEVGAISRRNFEQSGPAKTTKSTLPAKSAEMLGGAPVM